VRKWTYKPGELNGQPQDRPLRIELIFSR